MSVFHLISSFRLGEQRSSYSTFELVSGSIGWGAGLQSSRLVQGKGSNPLKVLIKENKK